MKACPFCGSVDIAYTGFSDDAGSKFFRMSCFDCDASGPPVPDGDDDPDERGLAAWNHRPEEVIYRPDGSCSG